MAVTSAGAQPAAGDGRGRGRPERREALVAGLVAEVLRAGVSSLSLRPLAAAVGTSDRMLLYYFGSRERLLTVVLAEVGRQLQVKLDEAAALERVPPEEFLPRSWAALRTPDIEPHLRLYVEISGLAARGREPFRSMAAGVAEQWLGWVAERLDVEGDAAAAAAAGLLTVLDGLLLMRFVTSADAADAALTWLAARIGADPPPPGAAGHTVQHLDRPSAEEQS